MLRMRRDLTSSLRRGRLVTAVGDKDLSNMGASLR